MILNCNYIEPHTHELPDNWFLGGPDGLDPRSDTRFRPTVYEYYNASVQVLHTTVVPFCDMEALDYCTTVAGWGSGFIPVWVSAKRPDGVVEMLPWTYDKKTDEVTPK